MADAGDLGAELELTPHAKRNRAFWNELSDRYQAEQGRQLAIHGAAWGVWQIPEAELHVLGEVDGRDVLELGCGAAQWSIRLAQQGARAVGLDVSDRQLAHARRLVEAAGVEVQLIHASAEAVPLPDDRFDIVFADHGALVFADPYRTVPEVSRLLRDGGTFAFSMYTPIAEVCWPADQEEPIERLANDYFGMHRVDVGDSAHVEFQLPYGAWIRLFTANGLEVVDLIELRPGEDATSTYRTEVARAWARRWPLEHIWKLRRQPR
ncbi:MAG TPA: class I SAM-dependent methyltransferase [Candidatus Limnocylindria bacterium]|nr:class I SAM-dependent methyltransferase [Candidatus Limnocylindria bacterium]